MKFIHALFLVMGVHLLSMAQNIEWISIIQNDENNWMTSSTSNDINQLYFGGLFKGSLTFGTDAVSSSGDTDGYLSIINSDGNLVRTISWGGKYFDNTNGIEFANNAIFIVGDSNSPTYELLGYSYNRQNASNDIFLAKLDTGLNEVIWHKSVFSQGNSNFNTSLSTDHDLINISGFYGGFQTITFNTDGEILWKKTFPTSNSVRSKIHQGKIYTVIDSFHFESSNGKPVGGIFKHRLIQYNNTTGDIINEVDVFNFESPQLGYGGGIDMIEIDNNNNSYLVGTFNKPIIFNGEIFDPGNEKKEFIAKFDNSLSPIWIKILGNNNYKVTSHEDNYWITWQDYEEVTNQSEFKMEKYTLDDSPIGTYHFSALTGNIEVIGSSIYLAGYLNGELEISNQVYSNEGFPDFLLMKLEEIPTNTIESNPEIVSKYKFYPNPSLNKITFESSQTIHEVKIFNALGSLVLQIDNLNLKDFELNVQTLKSGQYYLLINDQETYNLSIIK
jgi:Secretion system C-terminal sorting domain